MCSTARCRKFPTETPSKHVYPAGWELASKGRPMTEMNAMFVAQRWHRPYGKALLELSAAKRVALIAEAQDAIFTRYLDLCVSLVPNDEGLDLLHAVDALSQLRKTDRLASALEFKLELGHIRRAAVGKIGVNGSSN